MLNACMLRSPSTLRASSIIWCQSPPHPHCFCPSLLLSLPSFLLICMSSSDTLTRRGYLHLQLELTTCLRRKKIWQRVFVLLKDGCLFIYQQPRDLKPFKTYPLYASCCLFPQYPKVARSNCLQLETPTSSVFLCADSPADIKEW